MLLVYPILPVSEPLTIPAEAWPVVEELRRAVPRPAVLPTKASPTRSLRWWSARFGREACAMGLHPAATVPCPIPTSMNHWRQMFPASDASVHIFMNWHDRQTDPQALVDSIWGPE